jgi:cytochrome b pre-mRNA-processing protein 3
MAEGFYGRAAAYETAGTGDDAALGEALRRNLYRGTTPSDTDVAAMVTYMRRETAALDTLDIEHLIEGNLSFGAPPDANPEDDGTTGSTTS